MSRILVTVSIPASQRICDVLIPYECPLGEIAKPLMALFNEQSDGDFAPDASTSISDGETGAILDLDVSAQQLGLGNGARLMLV